MTSVEWLLKELEEHRLIKLDKLSTILFNKNFATRYELIVQQALEMHEHEISEAYMDGQTEADLSGPEAGTIYYNQKYKQ